MTIDNILYIRAIVDQLRIKHISLILNLTEFLNSHKRFKQLPKLKH